MACFDDSDTFSYVEKIVLGCADEISRNIVQDIIAKLKNMTEGRQSADDSGLANIWEEICVQLQTDFSGTWDLYDEMVQDMTQDALLKQSECSLAALQYSVDFDESDNGYQYEIEELTRELVSMIYEEAGNYQNANITAFIENEGTL